MSGSIDPQIRQNQLTVPYNELRPRISEHIHYHFTHGVLGVRDGGDSQGHTLRFKNEPAEKKKEPVILKVAGRGWHQKGRYGKVIGRHPRNNENLAGAFLQEEDPIDHVKLIHSGLNSLSVFGKESTPQFTLDELKEVVNTAHQRGQKVMVHANGRLPVQMALKAGCDSIEHGFFMGRENLRRMAETETTWVPTVYTMKTLCESGAVNDPRIDRMVVEKNLHHQLWQLELAREYGVTVAVGTDSGSWGVIHGESMVEELKFLLRAGYSLPESLQCATVNGAQLLGIDTIGGIAVGKPANFIVARATPAMLPRKLSYLEGIYLAGVPCDKDFFQKI
jgi:predicted amidohydrolase YtcJ